MTEAETDRIAKLKIVARAFKMDKATTLADRLNALPSDIANDPTIAPHLAALQTGLAGLAALDPTPELTDAFLADKPATFAERLVNLPAELRHDPAYAPHHRAVLQGLSGLLAPAL